MSELIDCLFATDDNYSQHMAAAIASLIANNKSNRLRLHIISNGVSAENMVRLERFLEFYPSVSYKFYFLEAERFASFPTAVHLSLGAYFRLFVGELLPADVGRVLYLDCDMIIRKDVLPLWQTDLHGKIFGAVRDPFALSNERLGLPSDNPEFNSGMLLIDLNGWREANLMQSFNQYIADKRAILRYLDQDVLNVLMRDRVTFIDYNWNFQARTVASDVIEIVPDRERFEKFRSDPGIIHFSSHLKPWDYAANVPFEAEYYRYLVLTPWARYVPKDKTLKEILKRNIPVLMKVYRGTKKWLRPESAP